MHQVSFAFATANMTALAGSDFENKAGGLSFAPGEISQTLTVAVKGDTALESNEQFKVVLSRSVNATIVRANGTRTIVNDDTTSGSISQF